MQTYRHPRIDYFPLTDGPLMAPRNKSFLVDGPLMLAPERRMALVLAMGADLIEADAFRDRQDAVRHLYTKDYPTVDIMILVDDAMQWAVQAVVAAEMSDRP